MEIAAHNDMNRPCLYDRRVLYLESPIFETIDGKSREGTSYIDTGIAPKAGMTYEVVSQFVKDVEGRQMTVCGVYDPTFGIVYYRGWSKPIGSGNWTIRGFTGKPSSFTDIAHWSGRATQDNALTMTLFAQHESDRVWCFSQAVRIYSYKCYDPNGKILQDLIPVKVGDDGAMFDKVSKKLFMNGGSDKLMLGPYVGGGED